MSQLTERSIFSPDVSSSPRKLVLLAPDTAILPPTFNPVTFDCFYHHELLRNMQKMRGRVYLDDGAIEPQQLTPDGRHETPVDHQAWHILLTDYNRNVSGCARYLPHGETARFDHLGLSGSALAVCPTWGQMLRQAVEEEMEEARSRGVAYAEVGGWALAKELRGSPEAIKIALATFALARLLGGGVGIATATFRNFSAPILQRLGGKLLAREETCIPSYYDPQYGCDMAILRFDSEEPEPRYESRIDGLTAYLAGVPIVCNAEVSFEAARRLHVA